MIDTHWKRTNPAPPASLEPEAASLLPRQATSVRDTGLEPRFVTELVIKAIHNAGKVKLTQLAAQLRLSGAVLREVLGSLGAEHQVESIWCGESDVDVQYQLTSIGQRAAADYLAQSRYVGPAPVTLEAYREVVERQSLRQPQAPRVTPGQLAAALDEAGFDPGLRDLLGAALHSHRALLLYGPSGSGKTTLAHRLGWLLDGVIAVPYALLVGRAIVRLYDPLLHAPTLPQQLHTQAERRGADARWALSRRPLVHVGAALTRDMLELRYDSASGACQAPPQLQANNGMLVIDDVGRQRLPTAEMANRWIGPLDHGVEQLSLREGHSVNVPFDVSLVFATDLAPQAVFDDALLRRIGYKIPVGALSVAAYRRLLQRLREHLALEYDEAALEHLAHLHRASGTPLLPSYPQELLGRIIDFASYAGRAPRLSVATLDEAWRSLFGAGTSGIPASPADCSVMSGELL